MISWAPLPLLFNVPKFMKRLLLLLMKWAFEFSIVPLFVLVPDTRLRLLPKLMVRDVEAARLTLLIVTVETSRETAELSALMATLYVVPPPLLGTEDGVQLAELLQLPVPPFQEESV